MGEVPGTAAQAITTPSASMPSAVPLAACTGLDSPVPAATAAAAASPAAASPVAALPAAASPAAASPEGADSAAEEAGLPVFEVEAIVGKRMRRPAAAALVAAAGGTAAAGWMVAADPTATGAAAVDTVVAGVSAVNAAAAAGTPEGGMVGRMGQPTAQNLAAFLGEANAPLDQGGVAAEAAAKAAAALTEGAVMWADGQVVPMVINNYGDATTGAGGGAMAVAAGGGEEKPLEDVSSLGIKVPPTAY